MTEPSEVQVGQVFIDSYGTMVIVGDEGIRLNADGSLNLRAMYPELYKVIGDLYAKGREPSDSFRLPDLRTTLIA